MLNYARLKERQLHLLALLRFLLYPNVFAPAAEVHTKAEAESAVRTQLRDILELICPDISPEDTANTLLARLPAVRKMLDTDVQAAYEGDPAATCREEVMLAYPAFEAISVFRIAHELYRLYIPMLPRMMTEYAHSLTGIDIHPGATIGPYFFIDHGTGVVIGETCVIGRGCRLYQGVTLGALSFPKGADGVLIKGIPRHPKLEDDVTVYAGATILGNITIGAGSVIGANTWVTRDVPRNSKVVSGD